MRQFINSVIVLILLQSCDVPVDLDIDQVPPRLVIEAQVTDQPGKSFVYLTWTSQFYDSGEPKNEQNAVVKVTDGDGKAVFFEHNADSLGLYLPPSNFEGEIGKNYILEVVVNGVEYIASDTMPGVAKIDSLTSNINIMESLDPHEDGKYYEVKVYGKEPVDQKNFYMFRFYRNYELTRRFEGDIYTSDDIILGENITGIPFPFYYAPNDTAVIEMYGISRSAFIYYVDLQTVLGNDGGMFSPPPANPRTNIEGEAMGFFLVGSIASDTVIVSE